MKKNKFRRQQFTLQGVEQTIFTQHSLEKRKCINRIIKPIPIHAREILDQHFAYQSLLKAFHSRTYWRQYCCQLDLFDPSIGIEKIHRAKTISVMSCMRELIFNKKLNGMTVYRCSVDLFSGHLKLFDQESILGSYELFMDTVLPLDVRL